jgi:5'-deoxynucleotidase YfbR-like HD superfamily hydrolase
VKEKSPEFIARKVEKLFNEFEKGTTKEARYAYAIDKFEGQIFWLEKKGVEMIIQAHKKSGLDTKTVHPIHMKKVFTMVDTFNFRIIKRFLEVIEKKKYSYRLL